MWISGLVRVEKSFGHVPAVVVEPWTSCVNVEYPIYWARHSTRQDLTVSKCLYITSFYTLMYLNIGTPKNHINFPGVGVLILKHFRVIKVMRGYIIFKLL